MKKGRKEKQKISFPLSDDWRVKTLDDSGDNVTSTEVYVDDFPVDGVVEASPQEDGVASSSLPISEFIKNSPDGSAKRRNSVQNGVVDATPQADDIASSSLPISEFVTNSPDGSVNRRSSVQNGRTNWGCEIGEEIRGDESSAEATGDGDCRRDGETEEKEVNSVVDDRVVEEQESLETVDVEAEGIVDRLAKLSILKDEPELSGDDLRMNEQLQEDEVLALKAIYGENVSSLEGVRGMQALQIFIHCELPNDISFSANLDSNIDMKDATNSSDSTDRLQDFVYSFKVQHLPPIVLTCLLPLSYPTHLPPYFSIYVPWLDTMRICNLCHMLDMIWSEQKGQEVIYQWVDWLHSSSLSYLGCEKEMRLGPYVYSDLGDVRAVSGLRSPVADIPTLMNYNEMKLHEEFLGSILTCLICYTEHPGTDFIRLPCKHCFCWKCMETLSKMHVKEGTVNKLLCPDVKCGGVVPPGILKKLLGDETFELWESLTLQKSLDSMPDLVYCPRCGTPCLEYEEHHAQCSKCLFSFCSLCYASRHVGLACMTPEIRLRILQDRQNSAQIQDEQRRKERELINEILSVKEALGDGKQCPTCRMLISKN